MATAMVGRDVSSLYPTRTRPVGDEVVLSDLSQLQGAESVLLR